MSAICCSIIEKKHWFAVCMATVEVGDVRHTYPAYLSKLGTDSAFTSYGNNYNND